MPKTLPVLMTPLAADFRCSACGDCCRAPWGVNVDQDAARAIAAALARRPHPRAITAEEALVPVTHPTTDAVFRMQKKPGGGCVFLDDDNLCYLHKHFGPEVKPATCRTYPFRPVQRPGGVLAPGSLSCRTLRRRLAAVTEAPTGALVPAADPELTSLQERPYERYSPGGYARLSQGRQIRIEAVQAAEDHLAALLCDGRLALGERLAGMRRFAEALLQGKEDRIGPRAVAEAFAQAVGDDRAALRRHLEGVRPDPGAHLEALEQLVAVIGRTASSAVAARQAQQFGGVLNLPRRARGEIAACVYRARDTIERPEHLALVVTFLLERLRASNITLRYGLLAAVQAQVLGAALVRAFACGRAAEQQRAASRADVLGAIEEVDLLFFHNLAALELFGDAAQAPLWSLAAAEQLALAPGAALRPAPPIEVTADMTADAPTIDAPAPKEAPATPLG